ncbi:FecR family protein [uncultured Chitinophaga sp.]|uniref:FecR family protein n=1 Tax=uncultured Chitinophaga sp. TaxID=339340 RepID=UPI0025D598D6|nr:FecR family protein [uncultured Chitinophaga sp.]
MNKDRLNYLFQQYQRRSQTPAEREEWLAALSDPRHDSLLHEIMGEEWGKAVPAADDISTEEAALLYERVVSQPQPAKVRRLWPRIAVAAAVLACLVTGGYIYRESRMMEPQVSQPVVQDVAPGGNKATLTLANGQKIVLSDEIDGEIAKQAGVQISKAKNGVLVYTVADNDKVPANSLNTLSTAKGETYKIILPDKTEVWLNAASSLTYPARFTGGDRQVTLTGEGYFEVAKDQQHPFKVNTPKQQVTVLGTHFNINAYPNEPATRTTLLEGSVKVSAGNADVIIKPGQQSMLRNGSMGVQEADPDQATAWKDDKFVFDGDNIQYIMRMVERWYNVEVVYEGAISDEKFYGGISRYENVSEILKILESTKSISFTIEGKTIFVKTNLSANRMK